MKLPVLSGKEVTKILCNRFGYVILGQSGSHVILYGVRAGVKRKPVVPMHHELARGTLLSVLKQAGITREEFEKEI